MAWIQTPSGVLVGAVLTVIGGLFGAVVAQLLCSTLGIEEGRGKAIVTNASVVVGAIAPAVIAFAALWIFSWKRQAKELARDVDELSQSHELVVASELVGISRLVCDGKKLSAATLMLALLERYPTGFPTGIPTQVVSQLAGVERDALKSKAVIRLVKALCSRQVLTEEMRDTVESHLLAKFGHTGHVGKSSYFIWDPKASAVASAIRQLRSQETTPPPSPASPPTSSDPASRQEPEQE